MICSHPNLSGSVDYAQSKAVLDGACFYEYTVTISKYGESTNSRLFRPLILPPRGLGGELAALIAEGQIQLRGKKGKSIPSDMPISKTGGIEKVPKPEKKELAKDTCTKTITKSMI